MAEPSPWRLRDRLHDHIRLLYPDQDTGALVEACIAAMRLDPETPTPESRRNLWSEADSVVITYGDTVTSPDEHPLDSLAAFMRHRLRDTVSSVHILPFYPWTSDDGFAVSDYGVVHPELGDWDDIRQISQDFRVMGDCVINHCSASHQWFKNYQAGLAPGDGYFVEADPEKDLSAVARPRTSPLLRPVETKNGTRHVWCTFGHDQIDLDFANPELMLEIIRLFRHYLDRGVTAFRLDAVGYVWKEDGTSCLNLAGAHEVVRLIRTLVEHAAPDAWIITETNVPIFENLAYFGNANEAHLIYNFSLPPLLLHALCTGNSRHLRAWMMSMPPARDGTTYFNFLASHDGIGLRPVEGLLDDNERDAMVAAMQSFGGLVSWRTVAGGEQKPYEINIALWDACRGTVDGEDQWQLERFICAHAVMLALEGIPGIYIHSLLGTGNDLASVEKTGRSRSINRARWDRQTLESALDDPESSHAQAFARMSHLLAVRRLQPAFHPNATQFTLQLRDGLFAFWRQSRSRDQCIFCVNNLTPEPQRFALADLNLMRNEQWYDLISDQAMPDVWSELELSPYQCLWITNRPRDH
jgi:sucrose phosphorylase